MRFLINLLIVSISYFLFSCVDNSSEFDNADINLIELDTFIVNNYTQDAKLLYLHELVNNTSHPGYDNPNLDTTEIASILKIIQSVYDLKSEESDTLFYFYKIHARYCYSFNSIYLNVNPDFLEIKNLASGIIPTGEINLDNLLNMYQFDSVKTFYDYPDFPWITIYSKEEYNMIPLEKEFTELPQILVAEFNKGCVGDGMNIQLSRDNNSTGIIFSIGSGDCPSGCIYHKYWEFNVSNGRAEFIKTYAD